MAKTNISSLNVRITGDAKQLRQALAVARGQLRQFGVDVDVSAQSLQQQNRWLGENTRAILRYAQRLVFIYGIIRIMNSIVFSIGDMVRLAAEAEVAQVRMTGVLGSAKEAQKLIADIRRFARVTPFQETDLTKATLFLTSVTKDTDELIATIKTLGDASAGSGADVAELARIYAQSSAEGRLLTRDINQFVNAGLPSIRRALEEVVGASGSAFKDMVEAGEISFSDLQRALVNLTSAGGDFANQTRLQAQTYQGLKSTLRDTFDALKRDIGTGLLPALKDSLSVMIAFVNAIRAADFETGNLTDTVRTALQDITRWTAIFTGSFNFWQIQILNVYKTLLKVAELYGRLDDAVFGTGLADDFRNSTIAVEQEIAKQQKQFDEWVKVYNRIARPAKRTEPEEYFPNLSDYLSEQSNAARSAADEIKRALENIAPAERFSEEAVKWENFVRRLQTQNDNAQDAGAGNFGISIATLQNAGTAMVNSMMPFATMIREAVDRLALVPGQLQNTVNKAQEIAKSIIEVNGLPANAVGPVVPEDFRFQPLGPNEPAARPELFNGRFRDLAARRQQEIQTREIITMRTKLGMSNEAILLVLRGIRDKPLGLQVNEIGL